MEDIVGVHVEDIAGVSEVEITEVLEGITQAMTYLLKQH